MAVLQPLNTNSPIGIAKKIRLSLCPNSGPGRGKVKAGILVEPFFSAIVEAASHKMKIPKSQLSKVRLFITRGECV